jgi:hypothetical protein
MKLKFKEILSNPYRDLKSNPLLPEKIDELVASINTTGFWDNVVVRKNAEGNYELAYGHHRIAAAIKVGLVEAEFIVKDLTDALMIQIMDNENREIYASSPAALLESVKAVVRALAEGSIPAFKISPDTKKQYIRYAPSYVPGADVGLNLSHVPYTALNIAEFLGRIRCRTQGIIKADVAITTALEALRLKELGYFKESMLVSKDRTGEIRPITTSELSKITKEINQNVVAVQERQGKTQAEIAELREKQLAAQIKAKADEKAADEAHKALVKKLADAERADNERKADELKAKLKAEDKRAQEKEVLNKLRSAELDSQIAAKREWEAKQQVQDAYLPIRRDVESMLGKLERTVSESNPFREDVKSLSTRKGITAVDRQRLRTAVVAVADWYNDWVAPQFAPELKAAQKVAANKRKAVQSKTKGSGA